MQQLKDHATTLRSINNLNIIQQLTDQSTTLRSINNLKIIQQLTDHTTTYRLFNNLKINNSKIVQQRIWRFKFQECWCMCFRIVGFRCNNES